MKSYMMKELNLRLKNTIIDDVIVSDMDRFTKEDIQKVSYIDIKTNDVGLITINRSLLDKATTSIESIYLNNLAGYIDTIHDVYKYVYEYIGKNVDLEDAYGMNVFTISLQRSIDNALILDIILDGKNIGGQIKYPLYGDELIEYFEKENETIQLNINCNIANKFAENYKLVENTIINNIGNLDYKFHYNEDNGVIVLTYAEDQFIQFKLDTFFKDPKVIEKIYFSKLKPFKLGMKYIDSSKYDLKKSLNHYLNHLDCHVESIDEKKVKIVSNSETYKFSFFIEPRLHDDLGAELIKTLIKYSCILYNKTFVENDIDHIYNFKITHLNNMLFGISAGKEDYIEITINNKIKKRLVSDENPILYKYMQVYGKDQIDEWNKYLAELNK